MELTILDPGPQRRIALADEVSIADAAELRDALALALTTSEQLELDLSGLESIDIAGLQILTALLHESHPVRITAPSEAFVQTVELLQLEPLRSACQQEALA
ncbi:lipid asymmetry maintenance protein MlaB [Uliginosibacterium sp. TH139]|uniref:STAS domain-containing protein n=1 Tax=Uliginosibacterium sp. TH139 TaxID=2067453 RepID=UPI000C7D0C61|nr:STAS domain-containing protein [Uliginosibacterium sp. TH139]PLK48479.1 hypothetical protein C0V76_10440 [Uliginosibacterium sp. TH139]